MGNNGGKILHLEIVLLQQTLEEEGAADEKLSQIAMSLNTEAVRRAG